MEPLPDITGSDGLALVLAGKAYLSGWSRAEFAEAMAVDPRSTLLIENPQLFRTDDLFWEIAYVWWRNYIGASARPEAIRECGDWLARADADNERIIVWAARLGWFHRGSPQLPEGTASKDPPHTSLFVTAFECSQLRFLLKFHALRACTSRAMERWPRHSYFRALDTLATLGLGDLRGAGQVAVTWSEVKDLPSPIGAVVRRACLDALWVGPSDPATMEQLQQYCQYVIDNHRPDDRDYMAHYLLAFACRNLAQYDAAANAIDRALETLRGESIDFLNEQFLRERDLIAAERRLVDIRASVDLAVDRLDETQRRLQQQVDQQTMRTVEILGWFTGIATLLIGGYGAAANSDSALTGMALIATTGVVAIAFFIVASLLVRRSRPD